MAHLKKSGSEGAAKAAEKKRKRLDGSKIALCSIALCILCIILLYLYSHNVQNIIAKVTEKGGMANVIWLIEHVSIAVPVAVLAAVLSAFYCNRDIYVPVKSQREQLYVSLITAAFTYAVMLPYVLIKSKSEGAVSAETAEEVKTLWDITYEWFFVQIIPFVIMIAYHAVRAGSEERELEEETEEKE